MEVLPLSRSYIGTKDGKLSVSSLIATLLQTFQNSPSRALRIDSSSTIILGPNVEDAFVSGIWTHAHRREEDQAVLVM